VDIRLIVLFANGMRGVAYNNSHPPDGLLALQVGRATDPAELFAINPATMRAYIMYRSHETYGTRGVDTSSQGKTFLRQVSPMDFVVFPAVVVVGDLHPVRSKTNESRKKIFP